MQESYLPQPLEYRYWFAEFGPKLDVLRQSCLYFSPYIIGSRASRKFYQQLYDDVWCYHNLLLELEPATLEHSMMQSWQLPLGLLFCLKTQSALIEQFFMQGLALPQWYEGQFIPDRSTALVLAVCTNAPALPRYSPVAKQLLLFRCNGLRCSTAELLLFLAFAPLSSLLAGDMGPGGTTQGKATSDQVLGQAPCQQVSQSLWQQALYQLDLLLFELYSCKLSGPDVNRDIAEIYIEDLLRQNYRQGLQNLWRKHWPTIWLHSLRITQCCTVFVFLGGI